MNWKFTLLLVAIVAVLYVFFDFYENKRPGSVDFTENATRVFAFDRNQIDGLTVNRNDKTIELARGANNRWTMKAPLVDRADQNVIDEVMTNLEILRWQDNIPPKEVGKGKLTEFGLQPPRESLAVINHGGRPTKLLFGNNTPLEGRNYLQLEGAGNVYVVPNPLKKLLDKSVDAWRDHHLTDIPATEVTRLVLKNAAGEIELQRDGEHWKLVRPLAARADDTRVKDTVSQITNMEIFSFVAEDKADAATYGLAEPMGTVVLYTANDPKGTEVLVGNSVPAPKAALGTTAAIVEASTPDKEKPPTDVYARMPSRPSVCTIPAEINGLLGLRPADLRDRSLVRINEDMVDRIHLLFGDAPPINLARKDKVWTILDGPTANQPVEPGLVDKVMSALTGDNIVDFVTDSASDQAKYGLDKPLLQIKVGSFASENTAESGAGEKPITSVNFGKDDDTLAYARVADEPSVFSVTKSLIDQFPKDPLQWQPLSIFKIDANKINILEVAVQGHPTLNLTRADKGGWAVVGKTEGNLNTVSVDALVDTLARLRAAAWDGPSKPEYGLDKPKAVIKFGNSTDSKIGGRMVLSELGQNGETYAQVDGKPGVFTPARPDYNALVVDLVPPPAAAKPTPGTTAEGAAKPAPTAAALPTPAATVAPTSAVPTPVENTPAPTPEATPVPPVATPTSTPAPESTVVPSQPTPEASPSPKPMATPEASPAPVSTPADIPSATATPA